MGQKLEGMLNQPSVARDRLFVGSNNNYLYALDDERGRLAWKWRTGGDVIGVSADTKGGAYYASLDNVLRGVNRGNGNQRWIKEIPTRPILPPQTLGDGMAYEEVVLVTGVSEIDAFAARTGAAAGMYVPPSDIQGAPLIDPALKPYTVAMVVITRDGRAFGLRPRESCRSQPSPNCQAPPRTRRVPGTTTTRRVETPPTYGLRRARTPRVRQLSHSQSFDTGRTAISDNLYDGEVRPHPLQSDDRAATTPRRHPSGVVGHSRNSNLWSGSFCEVRQF